MDFGCWALDFELWALDFGFKFGLQLKTADFGLWHLSCGFRILHFGLCILEFGIGALASGFWLWDSELWTTLDLYTFGFGLSVLNTGSMDLDFIVWA